MQKLLPAQKETIITCIGEGVGLRVVNYRLMELGLPKITAQIYAYYKSTLKSTYTAILSVSDGLKSGLALKENRIAVLENLAQLMINDLIDQKARTLWLSRMKSIGTGRGSQTIWEDEFNVGEVAQLRGILDDIAKETGGRTAKIEHTMPEVINVTIRAAADSSPSSLMIPPETIDDVIDLTEDDGG